MAGVILLLCAINFLFYQWKWLKSVHIYERYRKIKTGVPLFGPLGIIYTTACPYGSNVWRTVGIELNAYRVLQTVTGKWMCQYIITIISNNCFLKTYFLAGNKVTSDNSRALELHFYQRAINYRCAEGGNSHGSLGSRGNRMGMGIRVLWEWEWKWEWE